MFYFHGMCLWCVAFPVLMLARFLLLHTDTVYGLSGIFVHVPSHK